MKQYIKQKVKHKMKLYSTRVSVRQLKEQHDETKRSLKRRKKEIVTTGTSRKQIFPIGGQHLYRHW